MTRYVPIRIHALVAVAAASLSATATAGASITGLCPDGSVFIVQSASAIPCSDARPVDPQDVPPIKPEYLPRPYGWEVFNRRNDPNNPYNLVEPPAQPSRRVSSPPRAGAPTPTPSGSSGSNGSSSDGAEQRVEARAEFRADTASDAPGSAAPSGPFGLAESEIEDLARIVDLSQRRAPASILSHGSGGRLQLARSRAFESRARDRLGSGGGAGSVVLFAVDTQDAGEFHAHLTFVQGHVAYQPASDDPHQLGLLRGRLGDLRADAPLLGYVVLPEHFDLARPLDVYWNDQLVTATLAP